MKLDQRGIVVARLRIADIPEHPHLVSVAQAAKMLGITKTSVYYKIYDQPQFHYVFRLGGNPEADGQDERPILLLMRSEVEALVQAKTVKPFKVRLAQWHRRVKDWGRTTGWAGARISDKGHPSLALIEAYQQAHPDDVQPRDEAV